MTGFLLNNNPLCRLQTRDQSERKRKREAEIEEEENKKAQKEWNKNFEVTTLRLFNAVAAPNVNVPGDV